MKNKRRLLKNYCGFYPKKFLCEMNLKNMVDYFFCAIRNEISVDERFYRLLGYSPDRYGFLPRPVKWLKKYEYFPKIFFIFFRIFWYFVGAFIYFLIDFLRFGILISMSKKNRTPPYLYEGGVFSVIFSKRSEHIIKEDLLERNIHVRVFFPWTEDAIVDNKCIYLNAFSLLKIKDIIVAFFCSLYAHYCFIFRYSERKWVVQSYIAFRWFLAMLALKKLSPSEFIFAAHYDRWAVLIDSIVQEKILLGESISLVLVQHGEVSGKLILLSRLSAVTELFVYNKESEDFFRDVILDVGAISTSIKVKYFHPKIELSIYPIPNKSFSVLIVGHPIYLEFHKSLLQRLCNDNRFFFIYKPHPTADYIGNIDKLNCRVIVEKNFFPKVDCLVSYPSTLVREYAIFGVPCLEHGIDNKINDNDVELLVEKLLKMIKS